MKYKRTDSYMDRKGDIWIVLNGHVAINGFPRYTVLRARDDAYQNVSEYEIDKYMRGQK